MNPYPKQSATYLHAHEVIVEVHPGSQVLVGLPPQELLDKLVAVFQVVTAAAPLPSLAVLQVRGLITGATLHPPRAARLGHGMR